MPRGIHGSTVPHLRKTSNVKLDVVLKIKKLDLFHVVVWHGGK